MKVSNKVKHSKPSSNQFFFVAPSKIDGKGLFARSIILKGTSVVCYEGAIIGAEEGKILSAQGNRYIFAFSRKFYIDGSVKWNLARHANHSCNPNCEIVKVNSQLYLRSIIEIAKGEEITYNYGYSFSGYENNPCFCGAKNCVGFMVLEQHRSRIK